MRLGSLKRLEQSFLLLPRPLRASIVIFITCLVVAGDILTPPYVSFTGYYLVPIFISIWYFSTRTTFIIVFAMSLAVRIYVRSTGAPHLPEWEEIIGYVSLIMAFSLFSLLAFILKGFYVDAMEQRDTDELTGVQSRRSFMTISKFELMRRTRSSYPLTVAMVDIDNFKTLNDTQGHQSGDALLVKFSRHLMSSLRTGDVVGRLGGDEFAILLPNTNEQEAMAILRRLHSDLQPLLESYSVSLGASIGATILPANKSADIDTLLVRADQLMYRVKKSAKNDLLAEVA